MSQIIKKHSATGFNRVLTEKYYTKDHIVAKCIEIIKNNIKINKNQDICIEPSAGNGVFIKYIKSLTLHYKFYDIEPGNDEIIKQDYLKLDFNTIKQTFNNIHIIGNPPFGRQSSLVIKFIKQSAKYADTISFILPKSFKKDSLKKHFPIHFHLKYEYELPKNSFIIDNKSHNVPCVFQIWIKKNKKREVPEKLIPTKYTFVKKDKIHDISFRRVGVYAGKIDRDTSHKSIQSHYFIKLNVPLTDTLFNILSDIKYECKNNTVGPKSISKQELIKEFNKIIQ